MSISITCNLYYICIYVNYVWFLGSSCVRGLLSTYVNEASFGIRLQPTEEHRSQQGQGKDTWLCMRANRAAAKEFHLNYHAMYLL